MEITPSICAIQPGDMSLCNSDLMGDTGSGWATAEETNEKVDCVFCKKIYEACKKVKFSEFK